MKYHIVFSIGILLLSLQSAAQDPGFFLNGWQPKNITVTEYTGAAKPTAAVTATLNVDAASVVNKISPYLFGNNANPYMTQMVTEPVLLEHIKNLSPNVIRMPGGNISSVYFWSAHPDQPPADAPDSLYDSDGNKVAAGYWYGKNSAGWTLSLDNYYSMLQQTGNTGIITVNYSYARYCTGPTPVQTAAHLAAEWVRYDNGRTKFWEIGNESSGPWQAGYKIDVSQNQDGQPAIITGALYGEHLKVFADSMRQAASETGATIYIGAQLIHYDAANSWIPAEKTWNSGYFSSAGNKADYYIVHSYYTPFNENSTAASILNTAATETKNMMDWVKTTTQQAGVEMKPVALTEWNIFAVGSKQMVSHINGMHASLNLGELIKNKFGLACRWDLANAWENGNDHGTFSQGDEPGVSKWTPRPSFYHMYYFQKYFGDQMVASTVSGNTDVVGFASTFSSGQAGVVMVNKGTSAQVVKVSFQNFTPGNRYYWYTLTGDNDNGEFSRKVLVNGNGPSGVAGGPADYLSIKPNAAVAGNDVRITAPPRSVTFLLAEKSAVTGIADIDPLNKLIKIRNNPSADGNFVISFENYSPTGVIEISIMNDCGQLLCSKKTTATSSFPVTTHLLPGVYFVKIVLSKGVTVKKLVVN